MSDSITNLSMSMLLVDFSGRFSISLSVTVTNLPFSYSNPCATSCQATFILHVRQWRSYSSGVEHFLCITWKLTLFERVAPYALTGTLTRAKLMLPLHTGFI